jgi:hypothetical protein
MNGKVGQLDEQYSYRVDTPITTLMVDEKSKEILVMHDDQEDFDNTNDGIRDEFDEKVDEILATLKNEMSDNFKKTIEEDTWGKGNPMFYVDDEGWLIEHHQDGTKNKIKKMK